MSNYYETPTRTNGQLEFNLVTAARNSNVAAAPICEPASGPCTNPLDPANFIQPEHTRDEMVQLVERLFVMPQERGPVRLVLVSAVTRDADAERVSAWTAEMLASKNLGSVCLVDASVRSPNLHRDFSLPNQRGFAEFISDGLRNPRNIAYRIADSNFWVMPAGGNRGDQPIVTADHLNRCLQQLRAEFDFVIISAPVAVAQTAAMIIAPLTDGVVLVIEADRTRREVAWRTRHNFELARARLLGVVLNNRKFPIPRTIYQRL